MTVPYALRSKVGKCEIIKSLRTRNPAIARKLAYTFASNTYELFEKMAYDLTRSNPNAPQTDDTFIRYEIDLSAGILKSTDAEDHRRMMEALTLMESLSARTPAPVPASIPQYIEPQPEHTITLSKALVAYLATIPNEKTQNATKREISRFIEHCGDVEIHKVRGVDVVGWNAKLLAGDKAKKYKPQAPRTADNAIQFLQGLLKWAKKNEYIHHSAQIATEGKANYTKKQPTLSPAFF